MRDALQFTDLLRLGASGLELASYVMHGVHNKFKVMNRAFKRNLISAFRMSSLLSGFLGLPQRGRIDFLGPMEGKAATGQYRTLFTAFQIRPPHTFLRLANRRRCVWPNVQEYPAGLDAERKKRLTLSGRNA